MAAGKPIKGQCSDYGEVCSLWPGGRKGGGSSGWIQDMSFKGELTELDEAYENNRRVLDYL